ncbi:MAG: hypothetical protein JO323_03005 [Acidobacteriia bacterium]|nr:hypothetical protein [Terriglobia bacterium]
MKIEKQLFLGFARLRELWVVPGEEFRPEIGTVHLSEVQGSPWVAFEGLICPGEVRIIAADLGPTAFRLGKVGAALQACCIGHLMLEATKIAGRLDLTHIQVTGTGAMREGVWINTCRVEEGVRFWDEKWTERWENDKALGIRSWDHGAAVHGPVTIMNTTIGTSCDLTFLKAGGKVVIEGCTIGAHLRALSLVTLREELSEVEKSELDSKLRTEIGIAQDASTFRTIAAELRLVGTTVSHDVDLTGLTLMASSDASPQHGNVEARHLTVMGDIKAYATTEDKKNVHAVIPGHLNLADAEARRLTVSGHSFAAKKRSQEPEKNRFILTSGRFGTVFFPYFKRHNGEEPVPTDLADVDVRTWILDDVPDGKEPSEKDYKALLSTDRTFRRSTYRSMEANRRDRGYEEHADGIYREMHLRERREGFLQPDTHGNWLNRWYESLLNSYETLLRTPVTTTLTKILVWLCLTHWWRIGEPLLWNVVWRGLLRFGTDPKPLILVIFSLSAISLPVYRCADNMAPSPAFLAMHPEWAGAEDRPHAPPRRHPAQWSDWDTLAMTLRHHVPLAELGLREEWNLSTEAPLKYGPIALPVSPEDWGGFMTLVNIPMWAILVGFALRKFLRESRSEAG